MKLNRIEYARTYNQNYQSYRAAASAELEEWETDIDACYARLREIVRAQIGKQCADYNGADSDEVLVLKEAIEKLRNDRSQWCEEVQELNKKLAKKRALSKELTSSLELGNKILGEVFHVLNIAGVDLERMANLHNVHNKIGDFLEPPESDKDDDDSQFPM